MGWDRAASNRTQSILLVGGRIGRLRALSGPFGGDLVVVELQQIVRHGS